MRNLQRAVREALRYRGALALGLVCSLMVALCWAANIGTVYPFVELVCRGDSLHGWLTGRVAELEKKRDDLLRQIADLRARQGTVEAGEPTAELASLEDRLATEERALATALRLRPWVEKFFPADPFHSLLLPFEERFKNISILTFFGKKPINLSGPDRPAILSRNEKHGIN